MKKPFIIPFSGACLSGKTTTMLLLKEYLESQGYSVRLIKEPIRDILDYLNLTIDDLRSDFDTFIKVQREVISNRRSFEITMSDIYEEDFVFIDRSAADSFFYITYYPNKKNLTDEQVLLYNELVKETIEYVNDSVYDMILNFVPLQNIKLEDVNEYRPSNISVGKLIEYEMISFYNKKFFHVVPLEVDLNKEYMINDLKQIILDTYDFRKSIYCKYEITDSNEE